MERQRTLRWQRSGIVFNRFADEQGDHAFFYSKKGHRQKLLLIHGFGASALLQWYDVARLFKNEYDLIIPDLLCSGGSIVRNADYSISAQVEHLNAILNELHIDEQIIVCGNSYGGLVAAHFADRYPDRVSRLVLYDAPAKHYSLDFANTIAKEYGVAGIYDLIAPTNPEDMKKALHVIYHKVPYFPDFIFDAMFDGALNGTRDEQSKLLAHLIDHEMIYRAKDYKWSMPVHLLWGELDRLIPLSTAEAIKEEYRIADEHYIVVKDMAHAMNMENPKLFCEILRNMISPG